MPITDILVIGTGIAGLSYALKTAQRLPWAKITILTKADEWESNTKYAQGGIAVVSDNLQDSFEKHITDTLIAGDGLCDKEVVKMVVESGPERIQEMISWGASFDAGREGRFDLGREGGHTANRILHHKDITGFEIEKSLLANIRACQNIEVLPHQFSIDLITQHHLHQEVSREEITCFGAYVLNGTTGNIDKWLARVTMLAAGGIGQVYRTTTNPLIATGDGIAMAGRAKALIKAMEFVQFHPTALFDPRQNPAFLISEAVRGQGAVLRTKQGAGFMEKYDQRAELASRDIVAQAIDRELKKNGDEYVYLDCRNFNQSQLKKFPNIFQKCKSLGINPSKDLIPVVPAAHYLCGGVAVDHSGKTSINKLFACGECSHTGLHGANRLASNSLLEALVFAHNSALQTQNDIDNSFDFPDFPEWDARGTSTPREQVIITHNINELKSLMSDFVGVVRTNDRLQRALERIKLLQNETESLYRESVISPQLCELRNMIAISSLIIHHSLNRKQNRGGYFNIDLDR